MFKGFWLDNKQFLLMVGLGLGVFLLADLLLVNGMVDNAQGTEKDCDKLRIKVQRLHAGLAMDSHFIAKEKFDAYESHEKELAKIKADVDKTVGTAQAKAKGEDRKKKRERRFLVEAVYLIYNDGRLLAKSLSEKQETDAEILTGMLSAVGDFVSDSLGKKGHLGTMQHGDSTILIEQGKECHLAAVAYGKPGKGLKKALRKQLSVIEDEYIKDLKDWNGDVSLFADCTTNLVKIILQSTAKSRSEAD